MSERTLQLAIDDEEFGPLLRGKRAATPEERSPEAIVEMIRERMEAAGALHEDNPLNRKNRARLEAALDEWGKRRDLVVEWLEEAERFRIGEWLAGDDDFVVAEEAAVIRDYVIQHYRQDLGGFRIACVFAKDIPPANRRARMGSAMKLPGKMRFLSGADACLTLGWQHWIFLTDRDRQRLVHHELEHLELISDDDGDRLALRGHDFEDFASIVDLYGLESQSGKFNLDGHVGNVIRRSAGQLELLEVS